MNDTVNIRGSPNVVHSFEDRVILVDLVDNASSTLFTMDPVVSDPCFSKNLLAKSSRPFFTSPVIACVGALFVFFKGKCMGGCANSEDGFTRVYEVDNVFHLTIGRLPKAGKNDHHVCAFQRF